MHGLLFHGISGAWKVIEMLHTRYAIAKPRVCEFMNDNINESPISSKQGYHSLSESAV
jgi:hypothetical protein